jgi:anti-anti-sigma regulatory factor
MFRISTVETQLQRTLVVEGTFVGPWVPELRRTWRNACQALDGRKLIIDLCNVTVIGHEGEEAIFGLMKEGTEFSCGGVLMKHVLKQLAWKKQQESLRR